jgi:hypothetical protein
MGFDLKFAATNALADLLYRFGNLLSPRKEVKPDPGSPEGVVWNCNRVLGLFQAQLCLEHQTYCESEQRAKRVPLEYDQWCIARRIPKPFLSNEDVRENDILALTAGNSYNQPLLIEAAKLDPVAVANYLLLDHAGLLAPRSRT